MTDKPAVDPPLVSQIAALQASEKEWIAAASYWQDEAAALQRKLDNQAELGDALLDAACAFLSAWENGDIDAQARAAVDLLQITHRKDDLL